MQKRRYLAYAVFTDGRLIREEHHFDGHSIPFSKARGIAMEFMRGELRRHPGWKGALYEASAMTEGRKITNNGATTVNITNHEAVHVRVNTELVLRRRSWMSLPMEESMANAIADMIDVIHGRIDAEAKLRLIGSYERDAMRFIQVVAHDADESLIKKVEKRIRTNALKIDNVVDQLDNAANYLLYRECIAILKKFGIDIGTEILFKALTIADREGLNCAWEFLLSHLTRETRGLLTEGIALEGLPIKIVSPYSPRYHVYEVDLRS